MSNRREALTLPQEIYLPGNPNPVDLGNLALIGFINQEFALPPPMRPAPDQLTAWPMVLVDILEDSRLAFPESYRLVPNYATGHGWQLHRGWDTLIVANGAYKRLWSGEDACFFEIPLSYDQHILQRSANRWLSSRTEIES